MFRKEMMRGAKENLFFSPLLVAVVAIIAILIAKHMFGSLIRAGTPSAGEIF